MFRGVNRSRHSLHTSKRSFWLALASPTILLVGVFISETLFVSPSGHSLSGRGVVEWAFIAPAAFSFVASWIYVFVSLRSRDSHQWRWLAGTVTVNLLLALWLLAVYVLSNP